MTPRAIRAHAFATKHFGACAAHHSHAVAVHEALEAMAKRALLDLDPESTIGEILPSQRTVKADADDSLERVEIEMALEEELGAGVLVRGRSRYLDGRAYTRGSPGPEAPAQPVGP
jgi:hypothetical protein